MSSLCVLGLGYIGLPTASIFATKGRRVLGVDVSASVVETINSGRIHIQEPDLDVLVRAAVQSGNLKAATQPAPADIFILAVPTPFLASADGARVPDLSFVEAATRSIAPFVAAGNLIILESTSPVGTTEKVKAWLEAEFAKLGRQVDGLLFAHCPERILPGQMLKELVSNDRICGGLTPAAAEQARDLYASFCTAQIFLTDARTAELAKLTENAYRDVNIAFANELSLICDKLSIDVWELIRLANRHPRVKILQPGPGVGGHCIAGSSSTPLPLSRASSARPARSMIRSRITSSRRSAPPPARILSSPASASPSRRTSTTSANLPRSKLPRTSLTPASRFSPSSRM
ncbi:MAG: hypothetical protein RL495_948 [Verrucomicrobiota bacterium]|jgi:UDP-N-acetyl-D-mannosaminuronic acid dehydrogenase